MDLVIEERLTGRILALVELDDRTHRAGRDAARDSLTSAAGYQTIRLSRPGRDEVSRACRLLRAVERQIAPSP